MIWFLESTHLIPSALTGLDVGLWPKLTTYREMRNHSFIKIPYQSGAGNCYVSQGIFPSLDFLLLRDYGVFLRGM